MEFNYDKNKFKLSKVSGFFILVTSLVIISLVFIIFTIILLIAVLNYDSLNPYTCNEALIACGVADLIILLALIYTIAYPLIRFRKFFNKEGYLVDVTIKDKEPFGQMFGTLKINENEYYVKIIFISRGIRDYWYRYNYLDTCTCFIKESDLDNPKVVVLF